MQKTPRTSLLLAVLIAAALCAARPIVAAPTTTEGTKVAIEFDGPTPFPVDGGYESDMRAWVASDTWASRTSAGVVFHECPDRGDMMPMAETAQRVRAAAPQFQPYLADIRAGFVRLAAFVPDDKLNDAWIEYATARLVAEFRPLPQPDPGTCTTGRCDCLKCDSGYDCDCQKAINPSTCVAPRASCTTLVPKAQ